MALEDSILRFREQFAWQPEILNADALQSKPRVIVVGMGGSHLGAWLLQNYADGHTITIHRDYGLPQIGDEALKDSLIILSSYSGGTEEVLDAARVAVEKGLAVAAISTGGKLIEFAKQHGIPHVITPNMNLQPRVAIGFSMLAITAIMKNTEMESAVRTAGLAADPLASREEGMRLAEALRGKIPLIYSSITNEPLAYIWKIKLNESAKIPAFSNAIPEMCHNELCGFDTAETTSPLSEKMHALMLDDETDHPRNIVRMRAVSDLLREKSIGVTHSTLRGERFAKVFSSVLLADWVSIFLAAYYGVPDESVPLVEEFKKRIG